MFVPLLLTLHLATPPLRPPTLDAPELAAPVLAAVDLPRLLLQQAPLADPYAGSVRGLEIGGGVLGALGGEIALIAVSSGLAALGGNNRGEDLTGPALVAAMLLLMGQLGVVPLGAVLGAYWPSTDPLAGGLKGAAMYAYATEGIGLVGSLLLTLVAGATFGGSAAAAVFLVSYGALQFVGVPIAAAYGLHAGASAPPQPPAALPPQGPPQLEAPPSYTPPPPAPVPLGFALPF